MAATQNGYPQHASSASSDVQVNGFHHTSTHTRDPAPADEGIIASLIAGATRSLDRVICPSAREQLRASISQFASTHPTLSSFIAAQLFFSALPVLAFFAFAVSTFAFSLVGGLVTALCLTGFALLFLIPTLLLTTSVAVLAWVWAAGAFFVLRSLYRLAQDVRRGSPASASAKKEGEHEKAAHVNGEIQVKSEN